MSALDRTALRLATVLALTNNDTTPYPTMAEDRVFDSLPDPSQLDFSSQTRLPIGIVHIDSDRRRSANQQNGGNPFSADVQLLIELKVVQQAEYDDDQAVAYGSPATDPELETALDLFEHQVCHALLAATNVWGNLWRKLAGRVRNWDSDRYHDPDEAMVRFVEREIAVDCELTWRDHVRHPASVITGDPLPDPLPRPIRDLVAAVDDAEQNGGYAPSDYVTGQVAVLNSYALPNAITLPELQRLRMFVDRDTELGGAGGTTPKGPNADGIAQIDF